MQQQQYTIHKTMSFIKAFTYRFIIFSMMKQGGHSPLLYFKTRVHLGSDSHIKQRHFQS